MIFLYINYLNVARDFRTFIENNCPIVDDAETCVDDCFRRVELVQLIGQEDVSLHLQQPETVGLNLVSAADVLPQQTNCAISVKMIKVIMVDS